MKIIYYYNYTLLNFKHILTHCACLVFAEEVGGGNGGGDGRVGGINVGPLFA